MAGTETGLVIDAFVAVLATSFSVRMGDSERLQDT